MFKVLFVALVGVINVDVVLVVLCCLFHWCLISSFSIEQAVWLSNVSFWLFNLPYVRHAMKEMTLLFLSAGFSLKVFKQAPHPCCLVFSWSIFVVAWASGWVWWGAPTCVWIDAEQISTIKCRRLNIIDYCHTGMLSLEEKMIRCECFYVFRCMRNSCN